MGLFKINTKNLKGNTLHIVDANALAATKYYNFKDFSWVIDGETVYTGAIYAILGILKEINLDDNNRVIFCFDSKNNQRKEENCDYKAGRTSLGNPYFIQLDKAKAILTMCGYEVYAKEGYEADDFVVGAVNNLKDKYDNVIVYTNDDDMAQVIDDKVMIRSIHSKRNDIKKDNYEEVLGLPYNTVLLQKAIVGCKSDNVKGIPGVGDKKFLNILNECVAGKYDLETIRINNLEEEILDNIFEESKEIEKIAVKELKKRLADLEEQAKNECCFEELERLNSVDLEKGKMLILRELKEQALQALRLVKGRLPAGFDYDEEKPYVNYTTLANQCDKYGMKSITKHLIEQGVVRSII